MDYITQNFKDGMVLKAEHLINIENAIFGLDDDIKAVREMPNATSEDTGKFLRVNSDGVVEWQTVPSAEGVSF